jgi:hypothetical protein
MKIVVAFSFIFMIATAVDAQDAGVVLKMGRLSQVGSHSIQVVAVENHTSNLLQTVEVDCGFYQGDQLIASGYSYLDKIRAGDTGFKNVNGNTETGATFAKCRIVETR